MTGIDPHGKDFKDNVNPLVLFPPAQQEVEDPNAGKKGPRDDDDDDGKKDDDDECSGGPGDYGLEKLDDGKEMVVYDPGKGAIKLSSGH